ncbi:MAG TPA: PIG-L family deacetylase [Verrucomicrobiae bacterium]|nr:PIG-L family deacetylase [Verrucomicrobiae bacterium]
MKLDFSSDRILAVVAHPDDAELLCAGALARARSAGAAIAVCVLCNGDKGQPAKPIRNLASVRRREMAAAAKVLGAQLFSGKVPDGTLADSRVNRLFLTEVFRRFRPTLVLAHAPQDYHPDHRAASGLADAASWFCASRGYRTRSAPLPAAPALWWMDTIGMAGFEPGFYVDVTPFVAIKERMLACHKSQLARAGDRDFSPLADLMSRQLEARGAQACAVAAEAFATHNAFRRGRAW